MKGKTVRLNADNPEDMARMLRSGVIWNLPQFWQKAIDAIHAGLVPLNECRNVPDRIREVMSK